MAGPGKPARPLSGITRTAGFRQRLVAALALLCLGIAAGPAGAAERAPLLRAFADTAFSYLPEAEEARLLKWAGEVRIAGLGTPSRAMTLTVEELNRAIKKATGLPMGYTDQEVTLLIAFTNRPEADLTGKWARYGRPFFEDDARFRQAAASLEGAGAPPCFAKLVIEAGAIRAALIVVRTDAGPGAGGSGGEALANQCLAHELLGAMGIIRTGRLPEDSLLRQPTAAFAGSEPVTLSESDRALLWLIYHPEMPLAVDKADGMGIAQRLLEQAPGVR